MTNIIQYLPLHDTQSEHFSCFISMNHLVMNHLVLHHLSAMKIN
jgi:hypothetical protein